LLALDYPNDKIELLIADDQSTDETAAIVQRYAAQHAHLRLFSVPPSEQVRGKANAIDCAVRSARGEFILLTDADCVVKPSWVKTVLAHFTAETGAVCGVTMPRCDNVFTETQTLNWIYLHTMASAFAAVTKPISGMGNNLSFRKKIYEDLGGYAALPFSVTEDFTLIHAIHRRRWHIAYPFLAELQIITEPERTVTGLFHQQRRWILGGLAIRGVHWFTLASGFAFHILFVIAFFLLPLPISLGLIGAKCLIDVFFLLPSLVQLGEIRRLPMILFFEVYQLLVIVGVPISLLINRRIKWKARRFNA
jgi:1,2-diacylglycerol 3-beta-glucosyltransferase